MMKLKLCTTLLILSLSIGQGKAQIEIASSHFIGFNHQSEILSDSYLYDLKSFWGNYYGAGFHFQVDERQLTFGAGVTSVNARLEAVQLPSNSNLIDPVQITSQNTYLSFPVSLSNALGHRPHGWRTMGHRMAYPKANRFHFAIAYVPSILLTSQSIIRDENTISSTDGITGELYPSFQQTLKFSCIYKIYPTRKTDLLMEPFIGFQNNYFNKNSSKLVDGYNLGISLRMQFNDAFKLKISTHRSGLSEEQKKRLKEKQKQIEEHLDNN